MAIAEFKPARTRKELEDRINRQRDAIGMTKLPVWFRGQSRMNYNLEPSLFRRQVHKWQREHNMFADFLTHGKRFLPPAINGWEALSTMQHWGAPTRLLDWTTSLSVALFFAVRGKTDHPTVWMLNPFDMNNKAFGARVYYDELLKVPYSYESILGGAPPPHVTPMALQIAWTNERIERQSGLFTVHGTDTAPINEQKAVKSYVRHVVIAPELVQELRKQLLDSDTTPAKLFPDLGGLCTTLRWRYGFEDGDAEPQSPAKRAD